MRRHTHALFTIAALVVLSATACSGGSDTGASTSAAGEQTTTTFMPDCTQMPTAADISALVGVPMAEGTVVGSGSCQYLGANDQSKVVSLALFLTPTDQANWNDLQSSLGTPVPYADPGVPGALTAPDGTMWVTANGAIYTAKVEVNGTPASQQLGLAAQLLARWLSL